MEIKQYMQMIQSNPDWLPGKEAIVNEIKKHYDAVLRFVDMRDTDINNPVLNGVFVYESGSKCIKLTTCGLTQISPNEYALGRSRSGWGAELTATLSTSEQSKISLGVRLLAQFAQYINVRKTMFTEYSGINMNRLKFREEFFTNSSIAGIIFKQDTKLESIETIHGRVDFIQIISINNNDWKKIDKTPTLIRQYIHDLKKYNPNYCIDKVGIPDIFE